MKNTVLKKILIGISAVGPGLFLIGYNIGTGSITTMAKTGAEHGMGLFWALVLSCVFTFILMVAYGKVTLVSGNTALFNFKQHFKGGWILAVYIIIALIIGELLALMGIMGIVADLIQEGLRLTLSGYQVDTFWIILFFSILLVIFLFIGRYQVFEKVLTVFVTIMGLSFILVFFLLKPDLGVILSGMVPKIPDSPGSFGLIAAIAGTTCSAAVFIMRSTVIVEKGWTIKHIKTQQRDAFVSVGMMLFLSAVIMAVAAGTLHVMGMKLDNTIEMIQLFEPIGGKVAALILIVGIAGAGLSTVFPILLIAPWLVADYRGTSRDIHSPTARILIILAMFFAFGSVFIEERPPALMVFSQAFQACILPAVAIPIYLLYNDRNVMKHNKAGILLNVGLIMVIMYSLLTTILAVLDFFDN